MEVFRTRRRRRSPSVNGPVLRQHLRTSLVYFGELCPVVLRRLSQLLLDRKSCNVLFMCSGHLRWRGTEVQATAPAIVADPRVVVGILDTVVVDVVNCGVDVVHIAVVVEVGVAPVAAFVSVPVIAVAVIHAAVVADMASPIAIVPAIAAVIRVPVSWRPQCTNIGGHYPCAGNPVVSLAGP